MALDWIKQLRQFQYVPLSTALVGLLFIHPYLYGADPGDGGRDWLLLALIAAIPGMAIVALVEDRRRLLLGVVLGIPATISIVLVDAAPALVPGWILNIAPLAFYVYATVVICYHVVTEQRVRGDTLIGAVCGYLMLGYTWGIAYATLIESEPLSIRLSTGEYATDGDLFYFSFVTLTTLGYGDIVPVTVKARSLAMLEAITGVLYLAVLVSRLVAMYGKNKSERS
ncbi:MAG: hypothetical protein GKS06_06435 [Acidobacteria bacterium]|nr:hypothetical protein [Acidobacteriota bacterium]